MFQTIKNIFWHPAINTLFAIMNGFPARKLTVIGVTGTKGKSSVSEMLYAACTAAGRQTALINGIRFVYPGYETPNRFKMTMPGRGFVQRFLGKARRAGADTVIVEITSEATLQSRHRLLSLNGLIVTNIQKEHIEAHGSFENYVAAKREIVRELERSQKRPRVLVVNGNNEYTKGFLEATVEIKSAFRGESAPGEFKAANQRAVIALVEQFGIDGEVAQRAISTMPPIKGRVEYIECGQDFDAVVDYAHTPDSLIALYDSFKNKRKICVLGNTGGGRDTWKRPVMGTIAAESCDTVILTNEDPYNEDPKKIVDDMATAMSPAPLIIMDRREAIRKALSLATRGDAVLITGKGTDPYIMGAAGKKTPWSDAQVVREELEQLVKKKVS